MAEAIGPGGQRIKFASTRTSGLQLPQPLPQPLVQLSELMQRLEATGMVPILDDGLVGGNCACTAALCGLDRGSSDSGDSSSSNSNGSSAGGGSRPRIGGSAGGGRKPGAGSAAPSGQLPAGSGIVVSRSGKDPHTPLQAQDWVLLTRFDPGTWSAEYRSASPAARPTSDAPLHAAALSPSAAQRFGWAAAPAVAVHGHALASGAGLEAARSAGLPISELETLFSTPEDLAALESIFRSHPYPQHRCYIRRGHGFTLLHDSVQGAARYLEEQLLPLLAGCADQPPPATCES